MNFSNKITLIKNSRGVYDLDTSKGCYSGLTKNKKGCYGECYAARSASQYGYNFNNTIERNFENINHVASIRKAIINIDMPFIRIGVAGDPSENWFHFMKVVNLIYGCKPIVVITKHWNTLSESQLKELKNYDLCINTSISALDKINLIEHRLKEYNRLKKYCKSVLKVVSCDFNINNLTGLIFKHTQDELFKNDNVIDNVLRVSKNNELVKRGIINIKKDFFLTSKKYFSKVNNKTHTGNCINCPEMCGINI